MPEKATLIVFSHLRWDFVFQRPQHLLSRLSEHYRVVFVEEPVFAPVAVPAWEYRDGGADVTVACPHTPVGAPGFHDDQIPLVAGLLPQLMEDQNVDQYLVWVYTPLAMPLVSTLAPKLVIYDCMDALDAFLNAPMQLRTRTAINYSFS